MLKNITQYYQTNLISTTSASFHTPLLKFHMEEIGLERIMFSIDYPYQTLEEGVNWFNGLRLPRHEKAMLGAKKAIEVLRLDR